MYYQKTINYSQFIIKIFKIVLNIYEYSFKLEMIKLTNNTMMIFT